MDYDRTQKKFTAQGRETPAPVRGLSGRAGSPGPSACDRSATPARSQAGERSIATGKRLEVVPDPLMRRDSIGRSPPKKGGQHSPHEYMPSEQVPDKVGAEDAMEDEVFEVDSDKEESLESEYIKAKSKRPRENSSEGLEDLRKIFTSLKKIIRELDKNKQQNTRVEIKRGINAALGCITEIDRKWDHLTTSERERSKRSKIGSEVTPPPASTEVQGHRKERKPEAEGLRFFRDMGVQTSDEQEELTRADIIRELRECERDEKFLEIMGKPWPEDLYKHSEICQEDPVEGDKDLALYIPEGNMNAGIMAQAAARFPELRDMGKECQRDYIGSVLHATSTRDGETVIRKERTVYKLVPAAIDGRDPVLEFVQSIRNLREHMDMDGKNTVTIPRPLGISMEEGRKAAEFVLQDTEKKLELYEPSSRRPWGDGPPAEAAVVVKSGEKSFVEALRDVKEGLSDLEGVKLKAVKKTQRGDILLVVKGGMEGAKTLEDRIRNKTGMAAYARDGDRKTLLIQGMDGVTTKEEIMAAVQRHLKCADQRGFSVSSLRSTRRDNQTATLVATKDIAERLLADGRVLIGWLECKIKERIDLPKCFKCLEYGHTRANCKGPSREDNCFKCGKPGHMAKDCTGQADFCHACQREGHRSSSTNCPIFRKMISEARDKSRFRRGSRSSRAINR